MNRIALALLMAMAILATASFAEAGVIRVIYHNPSGEKEIWHKIVSGDDLGSIYEKYIPGKVTRKKIKKRIANPNGISNPDRIIAGKIIKISGKDLKPVLPEGCSSVFITPPAYKKVGAVNEKILASSMSNLPAPEKASEKRLEDKPIKVETVKVKANDSSLAGQKHAVGIVLLILFVVWIYISLKAKSKRAPKKRAFKKIRKVPGERVDKYFYPNEANEAKMKRFFHSSKEDESISELVRALMQEDYWEYNPQNSHSSGQI